MTSQKQSLPSFASIFSVLSIIFYCAGFLRIELELNEQKKRIQALESIEETKSHANILDLVTKSKGSTPGKFWQKYLKMQIVFEISMQKTSPKRTCSFSHFETTAEQRTQLNEVDTRISSFVLTSGAPNENIVQNHWNIELLNAF